MAISKRIFTDNHGKMFMPMNVDGSSWQENFFTPAKLIILGGVIFATILMVGWTSGMPLLIGLIVWLIFLGLPVQLLIRFGIFEEKYYSKMYKQLQEYEVTTPSIFWDIASFKENEYGTLAIYSDMKYAVFVQMERDTVVGKTPAFKETHYDAVSDFYKSLNNKKISYTYMNLMEAAGNDPRLNELSLLVNKSGNKDLNALMQMQVGHIKRLTRSNLYESNYFVFYCNTQSRMDSFINEVTDSLYILLKGAYVGFNILSQREIADLKREESMVAYFDPLEACLDTFRRAGNSTDKSFTIKEIQLDSGENLKVSNSDINRLKAKTSCYKNGSLNVLEFSIKETVTGITENLKTTTDTGVDLDAVFDSYFAEETSEKKTKEKKKVVFKGKPRGKKHGTSGKNIQSQEELSAQFGSNVPNDDEIIDF